jgi:hypothetical protein
MSECNDRTESKRTISYNDYLVERDELNHARQIVADYAKEIERLKGEVETKASAD